MVVLLLLRRFVGLCLDSNCIALGWVSCCFYGMNCVKDCQSYGKQTDTFGSHCKDVAFGKSKCVVFTDYIGIYRICLSLS